MKKTAYPIDSSGIYFLAQMAPDHTNVYRFAATLSQRISPQLLQQAVQRICPRFPTILAGIQPDFFGYQVVPVEQPPQVQPDPGLLLTMTPEEMARCAYRLYYRENQIMIEVFHALTDGFGAVASLRALLAEYVFLAYGTPSPEQQVLLQQPDVQEELQDSYPQHCGRRMTSLPQQVSYRLPGPGPSQPIVQASIPLPTQDLLRAARGFGVSITTMLCALLAESIMELQLSQSGKRRPVRVMVPIDLRRMFSSRTLRNFILYALPTLSPEDAALPRQERMQSIQSQLQRETDRQFLTGQITRNTRILRNPLFRALPRTWKCGLMRLSNHLFGECNSCITLTNLGPVALSEALQAHVKQLEVHLTPRRQSPYNCGMITCGDTTHISITHFGPQPELEEIFARKLHSIL